LDAKPENVGGASPLAFPVFIPQHEG